MGHDFNKMGPNNGGGWEVGLDENEPNSAQLELKLGLSLAMIKGRFQDIFSHQWN